MHPTKALLASTELLHKVRHSEDFGIEVPGQIMPNLLKIMERKNKGGFYPGQRDPCVI